MEETGTKKLIRSKSGFRMVTVDEEKKSPLLINEPLWTPDKEASHCTNCSAKFGFTTRKHHCRRCGLIFCKRCCDNMIELPRMSFIDPVRVCLNCEEETRCENKFFQHDLKILTLGAFFILNNKNTSDLLLRCKLSQDHRTLVFEGSKINPIYLEEITNLALERDENGKMNLDLFYIEDGQKEKVTFATTKDAQEKKTGTNWIKAIKQAYTLANERYAKPNWDRNSSSPLLR